MNETHHRAVHDVERGSNLDLLIRGFLGLGNRTIDAIRVVASAIAGQLESADLDKLKAQIDQADEELNKPIT
jgi:hypothetical protein